MKIFEVVQGEPDWYEARKGIATASSFDKIITPSAQQKEYKLKEGATPTLMQRLGMAGGSTQADKYAEFLIAERIMGRPLETMSSPTRPMERGKVYENEAADMYEAMFKYKTLRAGFITDDDMMFGCSPDRFVGTEGLIEIKCPEPQTHVGYLIDGEIDRGYYPQLQGQLYVTGRAWVDWFSYCPGMPPACIRVERDEEYLKQMAECFDIFTEIMLEKMKILATRGTVIGPAGAQDEDDVFVGLTP